MTKLEDCDRYDTWQADINLNEGMSSTAACYSIALPNPRDVDIQVTRYVFKLLRETGPQLWLDARGFHPRITGREQHFRYCTATPPSWVQQQVGFTSLRTLSWPSTCLSVTSLL